MSDLISRQSAIDAILEDLDFDNVKELRAYVAKNKQDDYFYGGILHAINAVQDLSSAQPVARGTNVLSNDTVSRQAAIDTLADMHCKSDEDGYVWIIRSDAWARLDALPSTQPEIIRCKDCKHRPTPTRADEGIIYGFSVEFPDEKCPCQCDDGWYNWYPKDDFYCGYAERRTDG